MYDVSLWLFGDVRQFYLLVRGWRENLDFPKAWLFGKRLEDRSVRFLLKALLLTYD